MLLPKRTKLHLHRGRRSLLPVLLLLATFGFCTLQLFLHPAHDASLWSFPTVVVAPLPAKNAIINNYNYNTSISDEDRISSSYSWGGWWWWERRSPRRKDGKGMLEQATKDSPVGKHATTADRPKYHLVFSTSCGPQQDWESFVFFYHAFKVGQPGNVVRMAET
jgi:hypothetical protein